MIAQKGALAVISNNRSQARKYPLDNHLYAQPHLTNADSRQNISPSSLLPPSSSGSGKCPQNLALLWQFWIWRWPEPGAAVRASVWRSPCEGGRDRSPGRWQGWLRGPVAGSFSPPARLQATVLEERKGDHRHQGVPVKARPGSALEVIEAEFLLHLLARLLAHPSGLDGGREDREIGVGQQVGEGSTSAARDACSPTSQASSPGRCCCPL